MPIKELNELKELTLITALSALLIFLKHQGASVRILLFLLCSFCILWISIWVAYAYLSVHIQNLRLLKKYASYAGSTTKFAQELMKLPSISLQEHIFHSLENYIFLICVTAFIIFILIESGVSRLTISLGIFLGALVFSTIAWYYKRKILSLNKHN